MDKYIILVNSGVYNSSAIDKSCVIGRSANVFSREEVDLIFNDWTGGEVMIDEDGEEVSIDDLIDVGDCGERINVVNEEMVEMSDVGGWVKVSILKLDM